MTTYRAFPSTNGPGSGTSYTGPWVGGMTFSVTSPCWFNGYYQWCPTTGMDTAPSGGFKCGLWSISGNGTGTLVPGSAVTVSTITAGQWNFIPLSTPIQLGIGGGYVAAVGWQAGTGFVQTAHYWGTGEIEPNGIVTGILNVFSDDVNGASNKAPNDFGQSPFSTAGNNGSVTMPIVSSNNGNWWVDVQLSDTAPGGYTGSYRIWSNMGTADAMYSSISGSEYGALQDSAINYIVDTEIVTSHACALNKIWYYSHPSCTQLATDSVIYNVNTQTVVAGTHNSSPAWKTASGGTGAAGDGWLYVDYSGSGITLPAGDYKVCVYNGNVSPASFNAYEIGYFASDGGSGLGLSNIVFGPLTVPSTANATEAQQATYAVSTSGIVYPDTYIAVEGQSYFVDMEVTPSSGVNSGAFLLFF